MCTRTWSTASCSSSWNLHQ